MSSSSVSAAPELCLVRYGELALKKKNRGDFERKLVGNIQAALAPIAPAAVERVRGRLLVVPAARATACAKRLQEVFGIASISPAWKVKSELESIVPLARTLLERALEERAGAGSVSMRVRVTRADKRFPLRSFELERELAERVLPGLSGIHVELEQPQITLGVDIRESGSYVYAQRLEGPGGLPVGTLGRGVCLISGGIDSPVAAYMAMKRGLELVYLTFHSYPYVGEPAKKKVIDLVRILSRFQPRTRLFVAPFARVNEVVRDAAPEGYRTILYRRAMQRIAARLGQREQAGAVITGESLGQVASQTVENLTAIQAATNVFVMRPLIGFDKEETVRLARRIGTFDLSAVQEPDCCTVFLPAHPVLRASIQRCEEYEARIDWEGLVQESLETAEQLNLSWGT